MGRSHDDHCHRRQEGHRLSGDEHDGAADVGGIRNENQLAPKPRDQGLGGGSVTVSEAHKYTSMNALGTTGRPTLTQFFDYYSNIDDLQVVD